MCGNNSLHNASGKMKGMLNKMRVLMLGPARSVNGGVSAVVNNYYNAGLDKKVELQYIGTMEDGSKVHKLFVAVKALGEFIRKVFRCEVVHIHMASDVSIYRKTPFIWLTRVFGKKLVIQQHGGNIQQFYYSECGKGKQKFIQKTLRKADAFLVVAPYLKEIFKDIVEEEKIEILTNAIEIPKRVEPDYSKQNILFLGRLCKEKGIGAYQGGTCNETDRSAQVCVNLAMATQPDQILAKPGMGVDEGYMIVYNEMQRILAYMNAKNA